MSRYQLGIVKLIFKSPLHLSKGKLNSYESSESTLHSDTLKSALFVSCMRLYGKETANHLMEECHISSAFPFVGDTYYLPRPLSFRPREEDEPATRKAAKKIKYLTVRQMEQVLTGNQPEGLLDKSLQPIQPKIWRSDVTQRVKVSYEEDSQPFYMEKLYPSSSSDQGLYFITTGHFDESVLEASLKLLGDEGIGHQRSLGNGRFYAEKGEIIIDLPQKANAWMSLSLYRPLERKEIEPILTDSYYQFIKRGGWISSPESDEHLGIRKQTLMFFTEGSVFGFSESAAGVIVKGDKCNVKPESVEDFKPLPHPIWRDGRAIFLSMNV